MQGQSDTVSRDIPWEKWNLLSPEEIAFLKSLNFNLLPEKGKKEKGKRFSTNDPQQANAPAPHLVEVLISCNFCRTTFTVYFNMVKDGNALRSKRVSEEYFSFLAFEKKTKVERITETAITCEHCASHLESLSKSELIAVILKQQIKIKTGRGVL